MNADIEQAFRPDAKHIVRFYDSEEFLVAELADYAVDALQAGDASVEVGHSRNQRRQCLRLAGREITIVAAGVEAKGALTRGQEDTAAGKIAFGQRASDRPRHGEQATRGFWGAARRGRLVACAGGLHFRPWHGEETAGLVGDVAEFDETAAFADDIEQIAIFGRRLVDLMLNCT